MGFCLSSSSSEVPIPGEQESTALAAGARGAGAEPSAQPQLGVPVIRGRHHLVGKAILRAEGQLIRGLHAVVDLWEGQRKQGCDPRSFPFGWGTEVLSSHTIPACGIHLILQGIRSTALIGNQFCT